MVTRKYIQAEFFDSGSAFIRQVPPSKSVVNLRWNVTSTADLTVPDTHPIVSRLNDEPGARCAVWMVTENGAAHTAKRLLEGRVGTIAGENAPNGTVRIPVADDWQEFATMLGWQVPGALIGAQGSSEYWRASGKSEANAKAAIAANVARLGRPWDVVPDAGRGLARPLELRMDSLASAIVPPLTLDRLQLVIERNSDTGRWLVDVREGESFSRPITPQSGVLSKWSWVMQPATATRAVVGGRGDGTDREFALVVDAALEAELGVALEVFVDARNAEEGASLVPYGEAALADRAAKAGITATLRETSWFRFPDAYELGTKLLVQIGALSVEDVISEITVTHDVDSGFSVVPRVGLASEDPQARLVGFINNVATAVRGLERR
ncbi:MAG: hypothetical protein K0R60_19 [Microbacterium sp.]|jgi:hypothetical protein|nr:hypothetical protein [Microbacterium sp.]